MNKFEKVKELMDAVSNGKPLISDIDAAIRLLKESMYDITEQHTFTSRMYYDYFIDFFKVNDKVKYNDPEDQEVGTVIEILNSSIRGQVVLVKWAQDNTEVWFNADELKLVDQTSQSNCQHELKEYIGMTDSYKYCFKCNKKESEI